MSRKEGYLVVQKSRDPRIAIYNPSYRGVDRLVPWIIKDYEKGFDDPLLDEKFADDEGFIPTLDLAQEVIQIFTEIIARDDLEILWIREPILRRGISQDFRTNHQFLGFDVSWDGSPFYSIVSDFPLSEVDGPLQIFRQELNKNGLFDSLDIARNYKNDYLARHPEHKDKVHVVWEVFLIHQNITPTK